MHSPRILVQSGHIADSLVLAGHTGRDSHQSRGLGEARAVLTLIFRLLQVWHPFDLPGIPTMLHLNG